MIEDIERIKKSKIWVRTDKSNNIYQVSPCEYEQILNNKIIIKFSTEFFLEFVKVIVWHIDPRPSRQSRDTPV